MELPHLFSSVSTSLKSIENAARSKESSLRIGRFCGTHCWLQWMSGRLFCTHNRRMCGVCGETWFRFQEPSAHTLSKQSGRCHENIHLDVQENIRQMR